MGDVVERVRRWYGEGHLLVLLGSVPFGIVESQFQVSSFKLKQGNRINKR